MTATRSRRTITFDTIPTGSRLFEFLADAYGPWVVATTWSRPIEVRVDRGNFRVTAYEVDALGDSYDNDEVSTVTLDDGGNLDVQVRDAIAQIAHDIVGYWIAEQIKAGR